MEYTVIEMVTVNWTVCHLQEALFILRQIPFNAMSVNKTTFVFHYNTV